MAKRTCTIDGCERSHLARGWCSFHWQRNKHHGSPLWEPPTTAERFWSMVDKTDGCWLWTGPMEDSGYGRFWIGSDRHYAHRYSYELQVGPIPDETLDHLCRVRHCVRPDHLEPCSRGENTLRGDTIAAENAAKTHCLRGHPLSGTNVYAHGGKRHCRTCRADRDRRRRRAA